jgi:hypothetical protein
MSIGLVFALSFTSLFLDSGNPCRNDGVLAFADNYIPLG